MYLPTDFIQTPDIFSKYACQMINCDENFTIKHKDESNPQPLKYQKIDHRENNQTNSNSNDNTLNQIYAQDPFHANQNPHLESQEILN
jgi:hypothetical protein